MDRRHFLALCGASLGGLGGCFADPRDSGAGGTGTGAGSTADEPSPAPPAVPPLDGSWESFRHDAANTAATDDPGPTGDLDSTGDPDSTVEPVEVWQRATTTGRPAASPAAADGAFVVVSESAVVYARDASDGDVRWRRSRSVDADVDPVASDGTVVVADGGTLVGLTVESGEERWTTSLDGRVRGLAAADDGVVAASGSEVAMLAPDDGADRWRYQVNGTVVTPPDVGDDTGAADTVATRLASGDVLALDADTGERRWRTSVGTDPTFAPAVGHGHVYLEAGARVVAFDSDSGERRWDRGTAKPVAAPPVVTADAVALVTFDEDADPETTGTARPTDTLWFGAGVAALSPTDGSPRWRTEVTETYSFTSGPPEELPLAATDGRVFVVLDGTLHAYDAATGNETWAADADAVTPTVSDGVVSTGTAGYEVADGTVAWRVETGSGVNAAPAVVDNTVYVGSDDASLYALAANTGAVDWTVRTDGMIRASPAVADGAVYVGTMNGSVYAVDRDDGTELWTADVGGQVQSPAVADGTVYVGTFSKTLFAFDAADGTERWRTEADGEHFVALTLAVADGTVYGGANGDLRAFDAADGSERWRATYSPEARGERRAVQSSPAVADGRVFVNVGDSVRAFDGGDGTERWARRTGGSHHPPAVHDGTVYAPGAGSVSAVDAADGTERWRTDVGGDLRLAVGEGAVYGLDYDTPVLALDADDGSALWRHRGFDGTTSPALAGDYMFVGDDTGRVRAIGPGPG